MQKLNSRAACYPPTKFLRVLSASWVNPHHKYYRCVSFILACILTTIVYVGWSPLTTLLVRSGMYSSLCDPSEVIKDPDVGCTAQQKKFNQIYYVGLAFEAIIGALAGVSFDRLGPLLTGILGEFMFCTGWICFALSTDSFNVLYPGIILLAGAANMVGFPTLILADMFPSASSWITSVVVAAECSASIVPTILLYISNSYPSISRRSLFLYYFIIVIPCAFCFLISLPLKRDSSVRSHTDTSLEETHIASAEHDSCNDHTRLPEEVHYDVRISPSHIDPPILIMQLCSLEYILFTVFYILQQVQYAYFPNFVRDEMGSSYSYFLASLLPTQGLIGPVVGAVAQTTKTLPIACILAILMTLVYLVALVSGSRMVHFLIVSYVIGNSYIFTARFNYISESFPTAHYGVLVGFMGAFAGVITLIIGFLPTPSYVVGCVVYGVCGLIAFLCVLLLTLRQCLITPQKNKKCICSDTKISNGF